MVPRAVLMKSGLVSVNTARQVNAAHSKTTVNAARPMSYLSKIAHSTGNPQMDLQDQGVIYSRCSRHMTRSISYLTNYEEIDGGYVAFGGNPKGGKINGTAKKSVKLTMEKLMRMEQYLTFTDHALWEVIVNGDSVSPIASASAGAEAIPDDHLLKFHAYKDAKSLWEAIKNRFGGNKESKKMQKTILKQNYENFVDTSEGLDKPMLGFKNLICQMKYMVELSLKEDANRLYYAASFKDQASTASYANDVMFSFFANHSNSPQLDYEDLEQI
ncbi:hypothetical protein Tco_0573568 [Tanacetum coccineum]